MTRINLTVDGARSPTTSNPACCSCSTSARSSARPAPSSGATPATAAPARSTSTARSVKSCNVLAVQADGREVTTIEGLATNGDPAPGAGGVPRVPRPAVRLLHAGDDHAEHRPAERQPAPVRGRRSATGSRATCAAAPATTTSCGPCSTPPAATEGAPHDRHPGAPGARDRPRPAPQGGPAADHRADPLDRQHHPARDAAPGHGAQPVRAREDHQHRHQRRQGRAQRGGRAHRRRPRRHPGRQHQRLADHPRPGGPDPPADAQRPGRLRRRDRRRA